eukprot:296702_1
MFYNQIKEIVDNKLFSTKCDGTVTMIVDRKRDKTIENDSLYIYNKQDDELDKLMNDYCLTFTFSINRSQNKIISYLHWGIYQKTRFFPEMVVSVLPQIFKHKSNSSSHYDRLQFIHSPTFKNGIGVDLTDNMFDSTYKKLTKY